ncbi:Hypothetical protein LUCI_0307 [Lucifera butyrica]|uniref:Uncharacterized protein n=1 Tax=Lucifera butyrica TaxID=1351585 RepID=A0A498R192_9FIRM|nr:hypothetical protein [Lucifera butyrica]VBB05101.1 Hypothetical protein LUCI_0307 [Lucifera butyrica]
MKKLLVAKCFKCDSEMIEIGRGDNYHFICPNGCSQIGPSPSILLTQDELDKDYEFNKKSMGK